MLELTGITVTVWVDVMVENLVVVGLSVASFSSPVLIGLDVLVENLVVVGLLVASFSSPVLTGVSVS